MGKVVVINDLKSVLIQEYEERMLQDNEVRIKTIYSGISAGTQLTLYRGTAPFAKKKWNDTARLFEDKENKDSFFPVQGAWAYEEVGRVVEMGSKVKDVQIGDIIYGAWGHRSTHVVTEEFALEHQLLPSLDPLAGIFAQMGAIAFNAILDANIHVGEHVVIFGQGVPGQIALQLAKLNGANVTVVDLDEQRLAWSKRRGADQILQASSHDVAQKIREWTDGRGADVTIEFSGALPALHEAIRATAYNGRVICSGFYQGEAQGLFLGEEFHHNRIQLICSQIHAVDPQISYRWDRLRMEKTIMQLQAQNKLQLTELVTHKIPVEQAAEAYRLIDQNKEENLQVVLQFE